VGGLWSVWHTPTRRLPTRQREEATSKPTNIALAHPRDRPCVSCASLERRRSGDRLWKEATTRIIAHAARTVNFGVLGVIDLAPVPGG